MFISCCAGKNRLYLKDTQFETSRNWDISINDFVLQEYAVRKSNNIVKNIVKYHCSSLISPDTKHRPTDYSILKFLDKLAEYQFYNKYYACITRELVKLSKMDFETFKKSI